MPSKKQENYNPLTEADDAAAILPNARQGIYATGQQLIDGTAKWGCLAVVISALLTGTANTLDENDSHGAVVPFAWAIALTFAVASNVICENENQSTIDRLQETAANLSLITSTLMVAQPLLDGDDFTWENAAGCAFIINGLLAPLQTSSSSSLVKAVARTPLFIAGMFLCTNQLDEPTWPASCLAVSVTVWGLCCILQSSAPANSHETQRPYASNC